tara:strand:- start:20 stop:1108 length:1089 start_codon:yes stop_codon:yes gene_type:complete
MALSNNYRIFYAIQQIAFAREGAVGNSSFKEAHGVQSVGITTTFNLEQAFELGQLAIYENIEGIPDIEVTIEKVLDGYPPIYCLATRGATATSLTGRQNMKTIAALSIFRDTKTAADGATGQVSECYMSGLYVSSVGYTFPVDGNSTESVTLVGNNKLWRGTEVQGKFSETSDDAPASTGSDVGVMRREDLSFSYTGTSTEAITGGPAAITTSSTGSILPNDIDGISSSGTNDKFAGTNIFKSHIQNISCSTDLGREQLFELGRKGAYYRYVTFPVEVTTEFTVIATSGDMVNAIEEKDNLQHQKIIIRTDEGLTINAGKKNKLASVGMSGGDAGGDNVELTYTYTNFNDFDISHAHADASI